MGLYAALNLGFILPVVHLAGRSREEIRGTLSYDLAFIGSTLITARGSDGILSSGGSQMLLEEFKSRQRLIPFAGIGLFYCSYQFVNVLFG